MNRPFLRQHDRNLNGIRLLRLLVGYFYPLMLVCPAQPIEKAIHSYSMVRVPSRVRISDRGDRHD